MATITRLSSVGSTRGSALCLAASVALLAGCNPDIFDVDVDLTPEKFTMNLGSTVGSIPTVPCDMAADPTTSVCGTSDVIELADGSGQATVSAGCDDAVGRCFVQADARVSQMVDVLQDDSFTSRVGRKAVVLVRTLDVAITVPVNSLTFDVPAIAVFVGPAGSAQPQDPGVIFVDALAPIAAATTVGAADVRHLQVADGSPARDFLERSIQNKTRFVFVLVLAPRLDSGAPIPAGTLEVDMQPRMTLGVR